MKHDFHSYTLTERAVCLLLCICLASALGITPDSMAHAEETDEALRLLVNAWREGDRNALRVLLHQEQEEVPAELDEWARRTALKQLEERLRQCDERYRMVVHVDGAL